MKNTLNEKDDKKKREVVKKVIAYMTLGRVYVNYSKALMSPDCLQKCVWPHTLMT